MSSENPGIQQGRQEIGHGQRQEEAEARIRFSRLTPRERRILEMIVNGMTTKEIAGELEARHRTIETHRHRIMMKMGARRLADLVRLAARYGLCGADHSPTEGG